jgi:glycosyltransferase involved in cell wall biosynthesis
MGIKVNRVDVSKYQKLFVFAGRIIHKVISTFKKRNIYYDYSRSTLANLIVDLIIRRSIKKYPNTDLYVSTSFSFSPKDYTNKKVVLFCDWTLEYVIEKIAQKQPIKLEKRIIEKQNMIMKNADKLITLFPDVEDFYKDKFSEIQINYIGNVINSEYVSKGRVLELVKGRISKNKIVFIGKKYYKAGLHSLLEAVEIIKERWDINVDVIGMGKFDYDSSVNVTFHGYLDKSIEIQKKKYYEIIEDARVIVNTTPNWAGFSSMLESMHHGLPVVVTPYQSFIETFGNDIQFGYYSDNNPQNIAKSLKQIFKMQKDEYKEMSLAAYNATLNYTWGNYVEKFLQIAASSTK